MLQNTPIRTLLRWSTHRYFISALTLVLLFVFSADVDARRRRRRKKKRQNLEKVDTDLGKKSPDVKLDASLIDRTKEKTKTRKGGTAPKLQFEGFRKNVEGQMAQKREEAIAFLKKVIEHDPPEEEKPGLYFRLGELYWEKANSVEFQANAVDDDIYEAGDDKAAVQRHREKQQALKLESRTIRGEAIKIYKAIIDRYRDYERRGDVLFFLAHNLNELGIKLESLDYMKALITEYPDNSFVPDAWMAYGEFFFEDGQIEKALQAYGKVLAVGESRVYGYAMYKVAWCHYNLQDWNAALDSFQKVIRYSLGNEEGGGKRKVALRKEAIRDYVLTYSHVGSAQRAAARFVKVGGEKLVGRMLDTLADLFYSDGKYRNAVLVYRSLVARDEDGPRAPYYQGRIVDCAARIGRTKDTVKTAEELVALFRRAAKRARESGSEEDRARLNEAAKLAEKTLRSLALSYHQEGMKTRNSEVLDVAAEMYDDYLKLFSKSKHAYVLRFYQGELLYKLQRYAQASVAYTKVLLEKPKQGKFRMDAALNAVLALEKDVKRATRGKVMSKVAGDNLEAQPIPPQEKRFVAACNNYLEHIPEGDKRIEVSFKVAKVLYNRNHFDEAAKAFSEIVLKNPGHRLATFSANLILDTFNLKKDFVALNEWARKFYENQVLTQNQEFKVKITELVEQSTFKQVADKQSSKELNDVEAAKSYLAFVDEFPQSKLADKALYNTAAAYANAGKMQKAIEIRQRLIDNYPDSKLRSESLRTIGEAYEGIVSYGRAAGWYEKYAAEYAKDKSAPDMLLRAAVFRESLRKYPEAIADRERFLEQWPRDSKGAEVELGIGKIYERQEAWRQAAAHYEKFVKKRRKGKEREQRVLAFSYLGKARQKLGDEGKALDAFKKAVKEFSAGGRRAARKMPRAAQAAAECMFLIAEAQLREFETVELRFPQKRLQKSLKEKVTLRGVAEKSFQRVVRTGVAEWGLAALYRIGESYHGFAKALYATPIPPKLTEDQATAYKMLLEEIALPIEDKAVSGYEICLKKSHELGVYNQWTRRALAKLNEMRPDEYPDSRETIVAPRESVIALRRHGLELGPKPAPPKAPKPAPAPEAAQPAPPGEAAPSEEAAPAAESTEEDPGMAFDEEDFGSME